MMTETSNIKDVTLPPTAVPIRITNILTPYFIKTYETKAYEEKLGVISKKLLLLRKRGISNADKVCVELKLGQTVLVHNKSDKNVELPAWLCRGVICSAVDKLKDTYNVLLTDYGISVELQRQDFIPCSLDSISEKHLSFTVGLYNVLPATTKYDSEMQEETSTVVLDEWSASAIQYIKELVSTSSTVYFDHLVSDDHGKHYGEFYLNIENTIISLSEVLVLNNYATYIHKDLLKFINNPENCEGVHKKINNETIFYLRIPQEDRSNNEVSKLDESYMKKIKKLGKERRSHIDLEKGKEKIFIYGNVECERLNLVSDAKFPVNVHKAWSSLVQSSRPNKIQSCMWPAMRKGLDVIAIGPAKSGKTFGYGFALCGLLATNPNLPPGVKPSALILCSSSAEVLEIYSLCTELLQRYVTIRCVAAINGRSERSLAAEMFNGCQILVTTPRFLVRFMNTNKKLLNFESLQFLIFDNGDIIFDKYFDSISKLFRKHKINCNGQLENKSALQIIVTAKEWTPPLKKFAFALMNSPYICIISHIEAAVFKSVRPKLYLLNPMSKERKTLDLLGDEYCKLRTIIVCINADEAEKLFNFLKPHKEILLAHENMNFLHLQGIRQCWNACVTGSYPILICTDEVLSDMNITNVVWLIHYSITLRSKTQFNFRFSTLLDSLQMEKPNSRVTIIIADENNDKQFLSVTRLMQRMNVLISPDMLQHIERITATLDKNKGNYPICNNVKSWGFCPQRFSCELRHGIIPKVDTPDVNIRINDKVKFRVLSINDVNYISARIVSYIKFDTLEEIEFSNVEYMKVTMKIQEFYSDIENRKRCQEIDVGVVCGLEEPVDTFKRVQILQVEKEDKTDRPKFVEMKCIDSGTILTKVHVHRLLHMPEKLIKYPKQVVDVFLVGVAPHDDEYVWNKHALEFICNWFKENVDERSYVIGTVKLHLENTIWVENLEVGTKLIGYRDLIGFSLKAELLRQDYAVENDKHLNQMYQLCKDAGFSEINGHDLNVLMNEIS